MTCFGCWGPLTPPSLVLPPGELNGGEPICDACAGVRQEEPVGRKHVKREPEDAE